MPQDNRTRRPCMAPRFTNQGPSFPNTLRMEWHDSNVYKAGEDEPVPMQFAEESEMVGTFDAHFSYGFFHTSFPSDLSRASLGLNLYQCAKTVARFVNGDRVQGAGIAETDFSEC